MNLNKYLSVQKALLNEIAEFKATEDYDGFLKYIKENNIYILEKLTGDKKKYQVLDPDNLRTIKFGATGYEDYTIHKDDHRKSLYIIRHESKEDWDDPSTAGYWSRWLLWNKNTVLDSMVDIYKRDKIFTVLI